MFECCVIVGLSWCDYGVIVVVKGIDEVVVLLDCIVFEYFEICIDDVEMVVGKICYVGVIFIGVWIFEVIGDYIGGLNYVLLIV